MPRELIPIEERTRDDWKWRSADGRRFTLDTVRSPHLVNIELFMLGRADMHRPSGWMDGSPEEWRWAYGCVRDEIEARGLSLHTEDHPDAVQRYVFARKKRGFPVD